MTLKKLILPALALPAFIMASTVYAAPISGTASFQTSTSMLVDSGNLALINYRIVNGTYNGTGSQSATARYTPTPNFSNGIPSEVLAIANDNQLKSKSVITGDIIGDRGLFRYGTTGNAKSSAQVTRYFEFKTPNHISSVTPYTTLILDGNMTSLIAAELLNKALSVFDIAHVISDATTGIVLQNVYNLHADLDISRNANPNDNLRTSESGVFSQLAPGQVSTNWQNSFTDLNSPLPNPFGYLNPSDIAYEVVFLGGAFMGAVPTNTILAFSWLMETEVDIEASFVGDVYVASDFGHTANFGFELPSELLGQVEIVEYLSVPPASVPLPLSSLLFASGLFGVTILGRKRRVG